MDHAYATCIGFWGKNCANPCSVGFYGHGCRQKCSCDATQFCDSALGCITRPGDLTSNCGFIKYVYNSLTSAHGINVCYNRATGRIQCCKGFTNRTGTCERPDSPQNAPTSLKPFTSNDDVSIGME
uniref:Cell death abnormality protein 1-like n=1 Tax=Crassostrea virginica TaxID=6565 RepID=A0A8B8CLK5_CRAVI|nr:cell death abnormality protein 1-like [Crassostrea virginica]